MLSFFYPWVKIENHFPLMIPSRLAMESPCGIPKSTFGLMLATRGRSKFILDSLEKPLADLLMHFAGHANGDLHLVGGNIAIDEVFPGGVKDEINSFILGRILAKVGEYFQGIPKVLAAVPKGVLFPGIAASHHQNEEIKPHVEVSGGEAYKVSADF